MQEYPYMSLSEILTYLPEIEANNVSEVARSESGFLTAYRKVGGNKNKLSDYWKVKRNGFIARHLAQYEVDHGYRRRLALIAWAYMPD
jgi:hypothetical protein